MNQFKIDITGKYNRANKNNRDNLRYKIKNNENEEFSFQEIKQIHSRDQIICYEILQSQLLMKELEKSHNLHSKKHLIIDDQPKVLEDIHVVSDNNDLLIEQMTSVKIRENFHRESQSFQVTEIKKKKVAKPSCQKEINIYIKGDCIEKDKYNGWPVYQYIKFKKVAVSKVVDLIDWEKGYDLKAKDESLFIHVQYKEKNKEVYAQIKDLEKHLPLLLLKFYILNSALIKL